MSLKKERFIKGIIIAPDTIALDGLEGEIKVDSATGKIQTTLKDGVNPSAAREIITSSQTQTLTNKTLDVDNNIVSNIETDNLKAGVLNTNTSLTGASDTQVPSALATKTYSDTVGSTAASNLSSHASTSSGVHGVTGTIVGTNDSQALTNKTIDADLNTISNIENADIKVGAAIDAAKIADGSVSNAEFQYLGNVTSDIQTQINSKEPSFATLPVSKGGTNSSTALNNNRVVQSSGGAIVEAPAITASRALISDANGIPTHSTVTSATLGFLDATSSVQTQLNSKVNASGGTLTNGSIVTPIRSDVKQDTKANLTTYALTASNGQLCFATDTKEMFQVVDGLIKAVGGTGGAADVNALLIQTFDTAALGDFTQTGLSLTTTNPVNGAQSAGLTHQAGVSPTNDQLFTQTLTVDRKFRGQAMQLSLSVRSTASQGNLTVSVRDVTNSATILSSQQIQTDSNPFTANTNSNTTLSNISNADMALLFVGDAVSGSNIPTGAVITALGTNQVTISAAATATATGVSLRASALPTRRTFSFTIPSNCASLSYTVTALPEANSPRSVIDDVVIELASTALLSTSVETPNVTAWQGYTPTFQGFGTPTNVEFEWRQVGENVEIRGKFTAGTTTAVEARVGLPAGLTSAGTGLIPSLQVIGKANINNSTAAFFSSLTVLAEPSVTYVTMGLEASTANGLTKQTGSNLATNGSILSFFASVPCAGLSATSAKTIPLTQSGLIQEADSSISVQNYNGYGSTATRILRFSNILSSVGDAVSYVDSATLGSSFTALKDGIYDVRLQFDSNSTNAFIGISKNASSLTTNINSLSQSEIVGFVRTQANANYVYEVSESVLLKAGDVIRPHTDNAVSTFTTNCKFSMSYQGSLKQVSVITNQKATIPTSELRFEGASSRGAVATAIVRFDTQARLRGDAFSVVSDANNGTAITMLKAGKLDVNFSFRSAAGIQAGISRNQSVLTAVPVASEVLSACGPDAGANFVPGAWSGFVNVGDVIRVYSNTTPTSNAANQLNLSFQEQSVQVSVSNVLPQFSESDLVVRAGGNAGQAITANVTNIPFITISDSTGGAWNGSQFTVTESGTYSISGSVRFNSSAVRSLDLFIDGVNTRRLIEGGSFDTFTFSYTDTYSVGQVISIRSNTSATLANSTSTHYLNITKVGKPNVTGVNVTPFVNVPQPEKQSALFTSSSTIGDTTFTGTLTSASGSGLFSYNSSTGVYTALKAMSLNASISIRASLSAFTTCRIFVNGVIRAENTSPNSAGSAAAASIDVVLQSGDTFSFTVVNSSNFTTISVIAEATSGQILTAPETFSTDTAALVYAPSSTYTLTTLANAPVGTYITFTYAANTNTRTQTTTRPTQTDADMNTNGVRIFPRAFNATSTAASPAYIALQIGKGLKGKTIDVYKTTTKSIVGSTDLAYAGTTAFYGMVLKDYDEVTGILYLDAGLSPTGADTARNFRFSDGTEQNNGYLVINASKNPALTGLGLNTVAARGVSTSGQSISAGTLTTIVLDSAKTFDTNGALNSATGVFTAPETGYYQVNGNVRLNSVAYVGGEVVTLSISKNGSTYSEGLSIYPGTTTPLSVRHSDVVFLAKGDTVSLRLFNTRACTLVTTSGANYFSIHKTNIGTGN
jgi:hypothetical protein